MGDIHKMNQNYPHINLAKVLGMLFCMLAAEKMGHYLGVTWCLKLCLGMLTSQKK